MYLRLKMYSKHRAFGVPPWGGNDWSDPRKRGTPNEGVRNKANSRPGGKKSKYLAVKELWQVGPAMGLGQTKPTARTAVGKGRQGREHCRRWGQAYETKPISEGGATQGIWSMPLRAHSTPLKGKGPQRGNPPPADYARVDDSLRNGLPSFGIARILNEWPR